MTFADAVNSKPVILAEGAVIEQLSRGADVRLDPHIANAGLIYEPAGRAALENIYRRYLDVGRDADLPMIILTPTWRANPERLRAAGLDDRDVNGDAFRLLDEIRAGCGNRADQVYVGGLLGCRGDAYQPREALSVDDAAAFHRRQADALCAAGVDFLIASTVPAASEARGLAAAMAQTGLAYIISVVVRPTGELLDGSPLHELVAAIDSSVAPAPAGFLCNCVHPSVFAEALARQCTLSDSLRSRVIGLQANASAKSPEELDGLDHLEADDPDTLADAMLAVHERFGTRILGGCCGTDDRHIRAIAKRLTTPPPKS